MHHTRQPITFSVALVLAAVLCPLAAQAQLTFSSHNSAQPHDWFTADNWISAFIPLTLSTRVPDGNTEVIIPGGQTAQLARAGGTALDVNLNTNDPNAGSAFMEINGPGANFTLTPPPLSFTGGFQFRIGKGKLTVQGGGTFGSATSSTGSIDLGNQGAWNNATLEINGAGSVVYGQVIVADNGSGTLNILNGGKADLLNLSAANSSGATATINVTGSGSTLLIEKNGAIYLGAPGNEITPATATMNVTAGAQVTVTNSLVSVAYRGATTATINLDGASTVLNAVALGTGAGTGNINISNGAAVNLSSSLTVGAGRAAGNRSTLSLSGTGTTVNATGQVTVQNPHVDTVANPVSLTIGTGTLLNVNANAQGASFISLGGPLGGETPGPSKISLRAGGVLQMAATGNMTIYYPATLEGAGTFKGALEVRGDIYGGGTLSPGDDADAGVLTVGSTTLGGAPNSNFTGAVLALKLRNDPSGGTAGTTWSQLAVNGTLTLPGTGYATVRLKKILADATTWNGSQAKTWSGIVATTGGITGFRTGALVVDANDTDFHAAASGYQFSVVLNGKNLDLVYGPPTVAPVIVTQPQPQTIAVGSSVTFSVVATGSPTPTYQWQKDGTPINGATNANYRLATTQSGDAGTYTVVVSNGIGTITSNGAALAFSATAPAIATQPKGQTVNVGASATFSVEATGTPAPTYQWRKDGTPISGATNASYTINSVQAGDAGSYTVALTNSSGVVTSSAAVLTVTSPNSPPLITTQPQSQSVAVGGSANFSVVASSTPAPTYQWQKNGAAISGATAATYTTPAAQPGDSGSSYAVVVTNSVGSVTSASATLTVSTPTTTKVVYTPYTFSTFAGAAGAKGSVDGTGGAARFSFPNAIAIDPSRNLYVADGSGIRKVTPGATVSTFVTAAVFGTTPQGAAKYLSGYNLVADGAGNLYYAFFADQTILKISSAGAVSTLAGNSGALPSTLDGTGTAARFTYPETIAIDTAGNLYVGESPLGQFGLRKITPAGVVTTVVRGIFGDSGGLAVDAAGTIYFADSVQNRILKITPTGVASVFAGPANLAADGSGESGYVDDTGTVARFNGPQGLALDGAGNLYVVDADNRTIRRITPGGVVTTLAGVPGKTGYADGTGAAALFSDSVFSLAADTAGNLYVADSGNQVIRAGVPAGSATTPTITTQPITQSVPPGGSVSLSVVASGSGPFTYQWRKNGTDIAGATNASLVINAAQTSDAAGYSVVVSNGAGSTTSAAATLTVVTPAKPVVTAVPQSQTVSANQTVTLAVSAAGAGTLSYQWNKNGEPIAGATGATLVLSNVQKTDAGSYTVTITNPNGSTTSDAALISVSAGPAITAQPQSQNVNAGSAVSLSVLSSAPGVSYQWKKNGVAIAGATNASYTLAAVASGDMGFYACTLTNANGATESAAATLTVAGGAAARPVNISTRALVTSAEPLTAGFVLSAPKTVVIRATGPALQQFGVTGVLADPKLELIPAGASTPLASNDDWGAAPNVAALTAATAASGAFPLPSGSKDSALLLNLPAGGYTARVTGADGGSGIALVEVYDADGANSNSQLINISARATVGTGGNSLVPGFVVSGVAPRLVLIRAIGPGLASFGVANTLADPQLTVIPAGASYSIAGNDNWGGTTALKTAFAAAGAFALDDSSKDAAVLLRLPPGGYTVVVSGTANASGTAIVEVYDLGP